jgi:hypothetical protein
MQHFGGNFKNHGFRKEALKKVAAESTHSAKVEYHRLAHYRLEASINPT